MPINHSDDAWEPLVSTPHQHRGMDIEELRHCLRRGNSGRHEWNGRRSTSLWGYEAIGEPLTLTLQNNVRVALAPPNLWLAHLSEVDLSGYDLSGAFLSGACLQGADLRAADLSGAHLIVTDLRGCDLRGADLSRANLLDANLTGADISNSSLSGALMLRTDVGNSILDHSNIHGVSTWGLKGVPSSQKDLVITTLGEPTITVDSIEVAQFVYLLLHNQKLRDVIDTITSKAVLILGRFTDKRKKVLDALREELRRHDYLPILFDFDVPASRDITETVSLLARMARFIIADLTDPSSIPKELEAIVPNLAVPVQPLLEGSSRPYAMFKDYWKYDWVLPVYRYERLERLLEELPEKVIAPSEGKMKALQERRRTWETELTKPQ